MKRWMLLPTALVSAVALFVAGGLLWKYGRDSDAAYISGATTTHWAEHAGMVMVWSAGLLIMLAIILTVVYGLTRFVTWAAR